LWREVCWIESLAVASHPLQPDSFILLSAPNGEQSRAAVKKTSLRCVAVVSVLLPVCCFAEAFTIEQVLSAPFPYGLTSASHVPRVAWAFDNKLAASGELK
jgi:hypothetical protein